MEHDALFELMGSLNRDVTEGLVKAVTEGIGRRRIGALFDAIAAIMGQQLLMFPYYFALFHQNRERAHFPRITGYGADRDAAALRVGIFTDSFDGTGDLQRFTRSIGSTADRRGLNVCVHTCVAVPASAEPWRKNFIPLATAPLGSQSVVLPPIAEVLEWADRQQFDLIHAETFGPMGVLAWIAAKMLRVPFVAAFQVDLPGVVRVATGDYRLGLTATGATGWFYQQADVVLAQPIVAEPPAIAGRGLRTRRRCCRPSSTPLSSKRQFATRNIGNAAACGKPTRCSTPATSASIAICAFLPTRSKCSARFAGTWPWSLSVTGRISLQCRRV